VDLAKGQENSACSDACSIGAPTTRVYTADYCYRYSHSRKCSQHSNQLDNTATINKPWQTIWCNRCTKQQSQYMHKQLSFLIKAQGKDSTQDTLAWQGHCALPIWSILPEESNYHPQTNTTIHPSSQRLTQSPSTTPDQYYPAKSSHQHNNCKAQWQTTVSTWLASKKSTRSGDNETQYQESTRQFQQGTKYNNGGNSLYQITGQQSPATISNSNLIDPATSCRGILPSGF